MEIGVYKKTTPQGNICCNVFVFVSDPLQSGAGELSPRRCSGESHLQGASAPLLSGEGGFQQGQGFPETHGAGERAQHQAVEPEAPPPSATLTPALRRSWEEPRELASQTLPVSSMF